MWSWWCLVAALFCTQPLTTLAVKAIDDTTSWTQPLAWIAFVVSLMSISTIVITTITFYKYKQEYVTIRYRFPWSYVGWSSLSILYIVSRMPYCGNVLELWGYPEDLNNVMYVIRTVGQNGAFIFLWVRIWLYSFEYKYDHIVLMHSSRYGSKSQKDVHKDDNDEPKKWWAQRLACCDKGSKLIDRLIYSHKHTWGNEFWLLTRWVLVLMIVTTTLVAVFRIALEQSITNWFYGLNLVFAIIVFWSVMTNKHDLLGLFHECLWYLALHVVAFVGLVTIEFTLDEDGADKRVLSWLGGAALFCATNVICSYFVFVRFQLSKLLKSTLLSLCCFCCLKPEPTTSTPNDEKGKINKNHLELVYLLVTPRNFRVFRKFLANIYCIENLDFFVAVQSYRDLVTEELEDVLDSIAYKKSSAPDQSYVIMAASDDESKESTRDRPTMHSFVESNSIASHVVSPRSSKRSHNPTLDVIDADQLGLGASQSDADEPLPTALEKESNTSIVFTSSRILNLQRSSGVVTGSPRASGASGAASGAPGASGAASEAASNKESPRKSGRKRNWNPKRDSSKFKLHRQGSVPSKSKNMTTLKEAARPYIEEVEGREQLQIRKIAVLHPQIDAILRQQKGTGPKGWRKMATWVFSNYIPATSANCLNLSSQMRREYVRKFVELKLVSGAQGSKSNLLGMNGALGLSDKPARISDMSKNLTANLSVNTKERDFKRQTLAQLQEKEKELLEAKDLFDDAQAEVWKLMAQDSMNHFRQSTFYHDVFKFVDKTDAV